MPSIPSIRPVLPVLVAVALVGCGTTKSCKVDNPEYLQAKERPRLQMPEGVSGSERLAGGALVIPPAASNPDKLDPAPRCLDEPPGYFRRVAGGAAAGTPEEAINVWAMAWASRKPDQVASFYSPAFQTTEAGGAAAYVDQRRQQVATGAAPEPRLEDVKVTPQAQDRSVVTFTQRFGDTVVRKELTLVREAQGWRIVAERTLDAT
jgi:hypothetical protein